MHSVQNCKKSQCWCIVYFLFAVCRGTSQGIDHHGDPNTRYERLKLSYTNCTFLDGNLEIVFLDGEDNYDLSFLKDIKEVTGYVLIMAVHTDYIPLTSLRIIRGKTLYDYDGHSYSLYLALNYKKGSHTVGLKELRFVSLHGKFSLFFLL